MPLHPSLEWYENKKEEQQVDQKIQQHLREFLGKNFTIEQIKEIDLELITLLRDLNQGNSGAQAR